METEKHTPGLPVIYPVPDFILILYSREGIKFDWKSNPMILRKGISYKVMECVLTPILTRGNILLSSRVALRLRAISSVFPPPLSIDAFEEESEKRIYWAAGYMNNFTDKTEAELVEELRSKYIRDDDLPRTFYPRLGGNG